MLFFRNIQGFYLIAAILLFGSLADGQTVVDKTVATVSDGLKVELITLSDLKWQLALQPNVPITPPTESDLRAALDLQINQRLFALEAERLPRNPPTDKEINDKVNELLSYFPTPAAFENRLRAVGFQSIRDPNFVNIISQRVAIDKYLDFRFRSFIVITAEDETNYYREIFVPDFRRRFPDLLMPTLDEKRAEINESLTEDRVAAAIEAFLDDAKRRAEINMINEI